jgi:hypothetical protein
MFGAGPEPLRTDLNWKPEPLPILYIVGILSIVLLFELLSYLEEFWRRLVPPKSKDAKSR